MLNPECFKTRFVLSAHTGAPPALGKSTSKHIPIEVQTYNAVLRGVVRRQCRNAAPLVLGPLGLRRELRQHAARAPERRAAVIDAQPLEVERLAPNGQRAIRAHDIEPVRRVRVLAIIERRPDGSKEPTDVEREEDGARDRPGEADGTRGIGRTHEREDERNAAVRRRQEAREEPEVSVKRAVCRRQRLHDADRVEHHCDGRRVPCDVDAVRELGR